MEEPGTSETPALDEWIDEVGEAGIVAAAEALKADVARGTTPVLRDAEVLRQYWDDRRRQRA